MKIVDFSPSQGFAFQGDVAIIPLPAGIVVSTADEIAPRDGKLILQEGELTGHHHHIAVLEREETKTEPARHFKAVDDLMDDALAGRIKVPTAKMYRDQDAADALRRAGIITRTDLCVGFLVVENGPMVITHQEHDGIRVPPGSYYIGRQVESAGAEERVVAD